MKKKLPPIEITELFLVKSGNDYKVTFIGEICRETTKEGIPLVHGSVIVNEGKIYSSAESQEDLGKNLDEICIMKLEMGLHSNCGMTIRISNLDLYLN